MKDELEKKYRQDFARSGGIGVLKKYGVEHFKKLSDMATKARKANKLQKTPQV